MGRGLASAALAAAAIATALPAGAGAATTCDLGGQVLDVAMSASGDGANLDAQSGSIFVQDRNGNALTCGGGTPTPTNTAAISVHSANGLTDNLVRIFHVDGFAPGPATEPGENGGTPEIEMTVNLFDGAGSELHVGVSTGGRSLIAGSNGINSNFSGAEAQPDVDIFPIDVPLLRLLGNSGNDTLSAGGGTEGGVDTATGSPRSDGVVVDGKSGNDTITGSAGGDELIGGPANDSIFGQGGADLIRPGEGDDTVNGGADVNTLSYASTTATGVTVDLGLTGMQSTGNGNVSITNVQNVVGTEFNDVLRGDGGANELAGLESGDTLEGRGGVDTLRGGVGGDSLALRDGGPDTGECGDGDDSVVADPLGTDTLTGCESVSFPAIPASGGAGASAGGASSVVTTAGRLVFGARTLVTLALAAERIPANGPLKARVSNQNGFEITGALSGETTGKVTVARKRRIKPKGTSFRVAANARKTVTLKLPRALRRLLKRKRRLSLRLTAKLKDPAGNTRTVRKRVRPKLRKRRR